MSDFVNVPCVPEKNMYSEIALDAIICVCQSDQVHESYSDHLYP